jgi:uncharacterized protein (DUF2141 family)
MAVDANGKLVVAVSSRREKRGTVVVRLFPDGRLDRSFGRNGKVVLPKI